MKRIRLVALAALAVLGLGACGSDSSSSRNEVTLAGGTLPDLSIPDISIPDISIPDLSIPNLTEECMAIALQFSLIQSQAFTPSGELPDLEQVFGDISTKVPAELRADVLALGEAFGAFSEILQASNYDFTDPEVQVAGEVFNTPAVAAASERVASYFEATCPQG